MKYSVVVPVHNERHSVETLYFKVREVMDTTGGDYEIIFVDDASTDPSVEILQNIRGHNLKLTVVRLPERKGMAAALQAGFDAGSGEVFITLDGDLQNDPEDIPKLLSKLNEGHDLVCGWRKDRKDPLSKIIASRLANGIRGVVTREKIHDVGCTLRVFRREVVRNIRLSGGLHRYFTALAARQGFRIAEIPVRHFPRRHGRSKFGLWDRFVQGTADLFRLQVRESVKR
ncbi:MAG: hypothetical protein A3C47_00985 [Omnitrophica bacterium RIFCSPHIGHO2_02_FULL_51_18]|nr:MAG: hypothetical protein A3C47_00985 [Omnitrophica bacterium RIFCSPHIGHO2_02_FULL_51_18]